MLASGKADRFKEQEILGDFLNDVFCGVLDYARPADDPDRHTISREKHVQVDGKFADAVLGDFREGNEQFIVALEGKGPLDPLDRPFAGRRMSAVDQGYRYAINLPCDWIIVTSIRQTRLYCKGCDQQTYERFDTEELARNEALLKKFVFLLGAERVVPDHGRCHLYDLLTASEKVGKQLTKEFYVGYANMRQDAFESLCAGQRQRIPPRRSRRHAEGPGPRAVHRLLRRPRPAARCRLAPGLRASATRSTRGPSGRTSAACSARSTRATRPCRSPPTTAGCSPTIR